MICCIHSSSLLYRILVGSVLVMAVSLTAHENDSNGNDRLMEGLSYMSTYLPYAVPEVAAGSLLDIAPDRLIRPGSLRDIAVQLLSLPSKGSLLPGIGVEFNPIMLARRDSKQGSGLGIWQGLSVSLGWKPDSLGERLAIGTKWTLYNANAIERKGQLDSEYCKEVEKAFSMNEQFTRAVNRAFVQSKQHISGTDDATLQLFRARLQDWFKRRDTERLGDYRMRLAAVKTNDTVIKFLKSSSQQSTTRELQSIKDSVVSLVVQAISEELLGWLNGNDDIAVDEALEKASSKFLKGHWSANAFALGLGSTFRSTAGDSSVSKLLSYETFKGYLTGSWGIVPESVLATLMLEYSTSAATVQDRNAESRFSGRLQFLIGSNDAHLMLTGACGLAKYSSTYFHEAMRGDAREGKASFGFEMKISKGYWLFATVGPEVRQSSSPVWTADYGIRFAPEYW